MKKITLLIILFLLLPFSVVTALESDINISAPRFYCYESSSNGHSSVNVIVINDEVIIDTANMDSKELQDTYGITDGTNLRVQFDYSVGDDKNWHHTEEWDPDKYGFFKSPLTLKCNAENDIFEGKILNLEFDEYLDLVFDYTYTGSNDGWDNVFIYDFDTYPLYIRARFVYTLEDTEEKIYIPFVSDWSDAVRVREHLNTDASSLSAPVVMIKSSDIKDNTIIAGLSFSDETTELIGALSHYDGDFTAEFLYAFDDGEYLHADIKDNVVSIGKTYTLNIPDTDAVLLKLKAKISYDGNEKYNISAMDSGYSEEASILLNKVSSGAVSETENNTNTPTGDTNEIMNGKTLILLGIFVVLAGIIIAKICKNKNK